MKKLKFVIPIIVVLIIIVFISLFYKKNNYDINSLETFNYYSGSSGYAVEYKGTKNGDFIDISFLEYDGADQNTSNYVIMVKDLEEILNTTKTESCNKHTYEYQCGDRDGCSKTSFSVKYTNNENDVCYKLNEEIKNFFDNLKDYYFSELDFSKLNDSERSSINLRELLEDIKSIKTDNKVINAKSEEYGADVILYSGKGYTIKCISKGENELYSIYCNDKEIMQFEI